MAQLFCNCKLCGDFVILVCNGLQKVYQYWWCILHSSFSCIVMVDFSIVKCDNESCDNISTMFYIIIHSAWIHKVHSLNLWHGTNETLYKGAIVSRAEGKSVDNIAETSYII